MMPCEHSTIQPVVPYETVIYLWKSKLIFKKRSEDEKEITELYCAVGCFIHGSFVRSPGGIRCGSGLSGYGSRRLLEQRFGSFRHGVYVVQWR